MTQNTVAAQAGRKPQKKSQFSGMSRALVRRETISAYLFLLPSLIFFVTFVVVPMFICLFYSFTEYGLGGVKGFAGLENYIKLFQDPVFHRGFLNTLLIVVVAVPCVTAFSLWVSSAIYKMHSISRSFFRCVFYLPVVTGSVAITVVWKWILNPYNGILNQVAGTTGFDWLGNPNGIGKGHLASAGKSGSYHVFGDVTGHVCPGTVNFGTILPGECTAAMRYQAAVGIHH